MDITVNYEKLVVALIEHFIGNEGTDYLGQKGKTESEEDFPGLSLQELGELTRLRDIARKNVGWTGY